MDHKWHVQKLRLVQSLHPPLSSSEVVCGPRPDNHWICYDPDARPLTEEAWNSRHFFHKPHLGFYAWPADGKTLVYDRGQSPRLDRTRGELSEAEGVVVDFFSDEDNVAKLLNFLSMEEVKGKDR